MSYTRLFYHLVWPTKNHQPLITPSIETELFNYIIKKSKLLNTRILEINGTDNHIHIIIEIPPKLSIAEVVQRLKGSSSHEFAELYWAVRYGAFTVSERNLHPTINYVRNQKIHHNNDTTIKYYEYSDQGESQLEHIIKEDHASYEINDLDF